jgi:hypothetical protein
LSAYWEITVVLFLLSCLPSRRACVTATPLLLLLSKMRFAFFEFRFAVTEPKEAAYAVTGEKLQIEACTFFVGTIQLKISVFLI